MNSRTRARIDADIDAHRICPLCLAPFRIQPRNGTASPVRICTGRRCDFWTYVREGEPGWTPQPTCAARRCGKAIYGTSAAHLRADGSYIHSACEPRRLLRLRR